MNKFSFLLLFLLLILINCKKSKYDEELNIGITIYRYDDNFISFMRRNIESLLEGRAKFIINDSEDDQAKQNDQVDAYIQRNVDAIAINLVDPSSASFMINKIKPFEIPIIFFNKEPKKEDMLSYDKVWYVGTLSEESGNIQGEIVLNYWKSNPNLDKNGDGKIQYVILKGEAGHPDAEARTDRIKGVLIENGIAIEELDEQVANWDILQAQALTDIWIDKYGDSIEFIFSNNDAMSLGALKSIQQEGYNIGNSNKFIPIVGVDAIPEVIEEIKNGNIVGTVLQSPKDQASVVVDMLINVASGKDVIDGIEYLLDDSKAVRVPYRSITIENLEDALDDYK